MTKWLAAGHGHKKTKCPAVAEFFIEFPPKLRFFQTSQEYQMFAQKCYGIPKINLVFQWTISSSLYTLQYYYSVVDAPDQTAGHGLERAKCLAVGDFLQIEVPLKGSLKPLKSIRVIVQKCQAIPKMNMAFQWTNSSSQ